MRRPVRSLLQLVLLITLCTIACYALSLAPVTWVLISEVFPNRIRGLGVSISVSALWLWLLFF
jgi:MFS transporter, SP family, xylose:H+ symportor